MWTIVTRSRQLGQSSQETRETEETRGDISQYSDEEGGTPSVNFSQL